MENAAPQAGAAGEKRPAGLFARVLRRVFPRRAGLVAGSAMAAAVLTVAQAQEQVPAHWIAYAQVTGNALQIRLSEGAGELITRLHERLRERQQGRAVPLPVVVRIWISSEGWVVRSDFDSLGDVQTDADLRAILSAHPLPEPPPPDMRQPMVLRLTLQPNPEFDREPKLTL
ncbi:YbaB/EbfC family DNA-binding protein [Pseudothauera rhizosphaerae]|uniref:YbaB/EbfC family DNA-binding protein n=1 Tax=Pseudothauera rhizosphaerae TaxID=2565932 RepID=A0A4S4ALN0_9RHOO|nr:YbaB/EbfC family DNA-binding protein [Pseudothauera rhizosphaerae]THF60437.1 YbaB/EbfC family DNA-binding protein [Pseudothauera rhizosphaerae]